MSGWQSAKLGDIFEIARGGSPRPIDAYLTDDPAGVNWVSISDASASDRYIRATKRRIRAEGVKRSRKVKAGDFLLTNSMSFGRPYIMDTEGCIHDGWLVLSPKTTQFDPGFFYYLLGSDVVYSAFARLAAGVTVKNLNIDLVSGVEVRFPPIDEQRRIAAILDQTEALRTQRRDALTQVDGLARATFLQMFGDPALNSKSLPLISLENLGAWRSGGTPPRSRSDYFRGEIPWFSSGELDRMYVSQSVEHLSQAALSETSAKKVRAGSLMLGMYDTAALKASIAAVDCSCNQAIAFSELESELAEVVYVYCAITIGREHFRRLQRGVRQKNLNLSMIREIQIPLPPMHLQRVFVRRTETIAAVRDQQTASMAHIDALFASLQHRAFSGQL